MSTHPSEPVQEELDRQIISAITHAGRGIARSAVLKSLPAPFAKRPEAVTARLLALSDQGMLHPWPGTPPKFGIEPFSDAIRKKIVDVIGKKGPVGVSPLKKELGAAGARLTTALLRDLVANGVVFLHPPLGKKIAKYALTPPDPLDYLTPALKELVKKNRKNFSETSIADALIRFAREVSGRGVTESGTPVTSRPATLEIVPAEEETRDLITALERVNPQVLNGAVVDIADWRRALATQIPEKERFDACVLFLARQGRLHLQSHDRPASLSESDRRELIPNGRGSYFIAAGLIL